ncbi:MAG TPA: WbuC family cupin fold metalloprotein [Noviherbaspirillum sp.]|jgi:cupin fold WbuC family metalloprotein|uniref:WbuC family cupin fold metalloprotein n=1 Tax=Noviherbaspirillum sp. TaxID=1926288 RepID=UPI002F94F229
MKFFSRSWLDDLAAEAARSPRLRQSRNLHESYGEPCQRLFNAICESSYIRPHRHSLDPKTECLVAVRGCMTLVLFDDAGELVEAVRFGVSGCDGAAHVGVELPPGAWHTVLADTPDAILFEVKAGPFDPSQAKELASWAPEEGSDGAAPYLSDLKRRVAQRLAR